MAALLELDLHRNSIDDGCVQLIVCGFAECKRLLSLNLSNNRIGDSGVKVLIQGLSASVETLRLGDWDGEVNLAREIPLLGFKELSLAGNPVLPGGS